MVTGGQGEAQAVRLAAGPAAVVVAVVATVVVAGSLPGRTQTLALAIYDDLQIGRDGRARAAILVSGLVAFALVFWVERLQGRARREVRA